MRIVGVVMLAALLVACGSGAGSINSAAPNDAAATGADSSADFNAQGVPFPPTPDPDPFYAQPNPMPDLPPGTVIDSRSITFAPTGVPLPNPAWQLKFISHDKNGQPLAAIATVAKPLVPSLTTPGPLLSYQHAEDSLGLQCAPSHSATGGTKNIFNTLESATYLAGLTVLGWTVVVPDHEGPNSAYAAGRPAGQIVLDAIRAAENFAPLGLAGTRTPVGMWGYSGGAIATAWAASLHASYAPELNIVAVATGGTPADVLGVIRNIDDDVLGNATFFNTIFSAIEGVNRDYPQVATPILNDKGRAAFRALANGCLGDTGDGSPAIRGKVTDYTDVKDPTAAPNVQAVAPLISLPLAGHSPIAPVFVYHTATDELIPIAGADAMVAAWCKAGTHVDYYRGLTGEHVLFEVDTAPEAFLYLERHFNPQLLPSQLPVLAPPKLPLDLLQPILGKIPPPPQIVPLDPATLLPQGTVSCN